MRERDLIRDLPLTSQGVRNLDMLLPRHLRNGKPKTLCRRGLVPHEFSPFGACVDCGITKDPPKEREAD